MEFRNPEVYRVQQVLPHLGVSVVQLYQKVIAAPVFIGKAVVKAVVPIKAHIAEPVQILRTFPVLQQITEREKVPAHMVKNPVQHHPDALFVAVFHKVL